MVKAIIKDGWEGRYQKDIMIPDYQKNGKIIEKQFGSAFPTYYMYSKKEGVIFGRVEVSGDRLDGWANHVYYIAIDEITNEIIGTFHVSHGWHGTDAWGNYEDVRHWKRAMTQKVKEDR